MSRTLDDFPMNELPLNQLLGASASPALASVRELPEPERPGRVRTHSILRFAGRTVGWFAGTLVVCMFLGLFLPTVFGYHSFAVMSGSMEPTIHTGDLVVDKRISPLQARVGDIVTFPDPADHTRLITHRVRAIEVRADRVYFHTKGDANNTVQRWSVPANGTIGRVVVRLYRLGYVLWFLSRPFGRILLIVIPVLALGILEIRRIWSEPEDADR
jgi:signal peptidase I